MKTQTELKAGVPIHVDVPIHMAEEIIKGLHETFNVNNCGSCWAAVDFPPGPFNGFSHSNPVKK